MEHATAFSKVFTVLLLSERVGGRLRGFWRHGCIHSLGGIIEYKKALGRRIPSGLSLVVQLVSQSFAYKFEHGIGAS